MEGWFNQDKRCLLIASNKHTAFLELARRVAVKNCDKNLKWKFGCVIVSSGRVISIGYNKTYKTHTYQLKTTLKAKTCNKTGFLVDRLHAEADCIRKVKCDKLKNSILYISRFDSNPSIPCKICFNLIKRKGIKSIVCRNNSGIEVIKF